jgi:hypothetical protein
LAEGGEVVGMTLLSQKEGIVSDLFLAARVNALIESGRLERQGRSAMDMRHCEVGLPAQPQACLTSHDSGNRLDPAVPSMVNRVLTSPYLW